MGIKNTLNNLVKPKANEEIAEETYGYSCPVKNGVKAALGKIVRYNNLNINIDQRDIDYAAKQYFRGVGSHKEVWNMVPEGELPRLESNPHQSSERGSDDRVHQRLQQLRQHLSQSREQRPLERRSPRVEQTAANIRQPQSTEQRPRERRSPRVEQTAANIRNAQSTEQRPRERRSPRIEQTVANTTNLQSTEQRPRARRSPTIEQTAANVPQHRTGNVHSDTVPQATLDRGLLDRTARRTGHAHQLASLETRQERRKNYRLQQTLSEQAYGLRQEQTLRHRQRNLPSYQETVHTPQSGPNPREQEVQQRSGNLRQQIPEGRPGQRTTRVLTQTSDLELQLGLRLGLRLTLSQRSTQRQALRSIQRQRSQRSRAVSRRNTPRIAMPQNYRSARPEDYPSIAASLIRERSLQRSQLRRTRSIGRRNTPRISVPLDYRATPDNEPDVVSTLIRERSRQRQRSQQRQRPRNYRTATHEEEPSISSTMVRDLETSLSLSDEDEPPVDEYYLGNEEEIPPYHATLHKYLDLMSFDPRIVPCLRVNRALIKNNDSLSQFITQFLKFNLFPESVDPWEISHINDQDYDDLIPELIPVESNSPDLTTPDLPTSNILYEPNYRYDGSSVPQVISDDDYQYALYISTREDNGIQPPWFAPSITS